MPGSRPEEEYHKLVEDRSIEYLGGYTGRTRDKVWWKCDKGHKWNTSYNGIRSGTGCPKCYEKRRGKSSIIPEKEYYKLARSRGFKYLGGYSESALSKVTWQCKHNHKWSACYSHIKSGTGCPHCAGNIPKTKDDYINLAERRDFEWLEEKVPQNTTTKTLWKCNYGHEWEATYHKISLGRGCPYCAGKAPKTKKDYHDLAKRKKLKWIGDKLPSDIKCKTKWMCLVCNNVWKTYYNNIQQDRGCPECAKRLWGERISGENHWNWNPDLTDEEREESRYYSGYYTWRVNVLERDKHICQICLKQAETTHHIFSYKDHKDLKVNINNGISLCQKCHTSFHSWMGGFLVPCTAKDFIIWLNNINKLRPSVIKQVNSLINDYRKQ